MKSHANGRKSQLSRIEEEEGRIGKHPEEVDREAPSEDDVARALGMQFVDAESAPTTDISNSFLETVEKSDPTSDVLQNVLGMIVKRLETLERENTQMQKRIENLEKDNREKGDRITDLEDEVEELEDAKEASERAVATSKELASAVNAIQDESDDVSKTNDCAPGDDHPAEASSPIDFFVNCQQFFVNRKISANRTRAVQVVRRCDEFGQVGRGNGAVIFEKGDIAQALHVIMEKKPHRETVNRVWEFIDEMGKQDVYQTTVQVGKGDSKKEVLKIDDETVDRFNEGRYVGLNLLEGMSDGDAQNIAQGGGVTPVVMGATA